MNYKQGPYNKFDDLEQWIRISEGCPNGCEFCGETKHNGIKPRYFSIPELIRNKVKIMDMNLTYKPDFVGIADRLGNTKANGKVIQYELICGIDYRSFTQDKANALRRNRFVNIRLAWDHEKSEGKYVYRAVECLFKAGYRPRDIMIFILCNWKRPYEEVLEKLDYLKVWGVKVGDCYFDNQLSPNIEPIYWTEEQIKACRRKCRKHNQLIRFKFDPEIIAGQKELF
jgi:radical SAM superfamily enzyme YgiQ (UPF0313 family)